MSSAATPPSTGARRLALDSLGVLPTQQRRGIGHAVMHAVLTAADALEEPIVFLLGDLAY